MRRVSVLEKRVPNRRRGDSGMSLRRLFLFGDEGREQGQIENTEYGWRKRRTTYLVRGRENFESHEPKLPAEI